MRKEEVSGLKKIESSKKSRSFLLKLALVVFVVYILGMLINLQVQIRDQQEKYAQVQEEISQQKAENEAILNSLETDDEEYMEKVAREKLGYAKPGDQIFVNIAGN